MLESKEALEILIGKKHFCKITTLQLEVDSNMMAKQWNTYSYAYQDLFIENNSQSNW